MAIAAAGCSATLVALSSSSNKSPFKDKASHALSYSDQNSLPIETLFARFLYGISNSSSFSKEIELPGNLKI